MQTLHGFFAAGLLDKLRELSLRLGGDFNLLVIVGAFAVVTLAAFAWAIAVRKQPHRHRHHHRPPPKPATPADDEKPKGGGIFSRHRHKHRRKEHRPVNPTLAETGGLPATRDENTPPKSHL